MASESTAMESEEAAAETMTTPASEIEERRWSIATYESVAVSNLTYDEAVEWIKKLESQKISGLCIITDEAAARLSQS